MEDSLNLEQKYRYLVENTKDVFYTLDLEGRFVDISFSGEALTGFSLEEWLGKNFEGIVTEKSRDLAIQNFKRVLQEKCELEFEVEIYTKSGGSKIVELGQKAIVSENRVVGVQGIARDVTERKVLEQKVRDYTRNLENLVEERTKEIKRLKDFNEQIIEQNSLGIIVLDKDMRVAKWNRAAFSILNISAEQVLGKPLFEVHPGFRSREIQKRIQILLAAGAPSGVEMCSWPTERGVEKNLQLSFSPLLNFGEITGLSIIIEDISKRIEVERKVRLLSWGVEQTIEGVAVTGLDGNFIFVNRAWAEMHGMDQPEILGKHLDDLHSPEKRGAFQKLYRSLLEAGEDSGEIEHIRSDGTTIFAFEASTLLRDQSGKPMAIMCISRDITQQKKAEAELRRRTEELSVLNTIASIVNRSLDPVQIADRALEEIMRYMKIPKGGIYLRQGETMVLTASRGISSTFKERGNRIQAGDFPKMEPWFRPERVSSGETSNPWVLEEGIVSGIVVPLTFEGELRGLVMLGRTSLEACREPGLLLLETLGKQLSVAFEKARLYALEQEKSLRLALVNEVSRKISTILDMDVLFKELVRLIKEAFNYYNVNLTLIDGEDLIFKAGFMEGEGHFALGRRLRVGSNSIIGWVAREGKPLLVPDVEKEPRYLYYEGLPETRSELAVPIQVKGKVVGVLDVQSDRKGGLAEGDMELVQALAGQIGSAIENAFLFRKLSDSRQEYTDLYENAPAMYHRLNPKGIIISVNRLESETLGYPKDKIIGRPFTDFLTEESRKKFDRNLSLLLEKGSVNYEVDLINAKGEIVHAAMSCVLRRDTENRPVMTLGILRDITQVKKLERQLIQSEKLAVLGEMAAGLAHEVRNPLSGIAGAVEVLKESFKNGDHQRGVVDEILSQISRIDRLVKSLLTFARPTDLQFVPVDVHKLLENILIYLQSDPASKGLKIRRKFLAPNPVVQVDPAQVEQVFQNIILNAFQAMKAGGILTLTTQEKNSKLLISFKDTGKGIPRRHLKDVFRPFFSTKAQGTGLGLSIVQRIVEAHQGDITLETAEGGGTTVTIFLPIHKGVE